MATGCKPPSIFTRAISFPPEKKGLSCWGNLPSSIRGRSLVSDFTKLSPALPFDLLLESLTPWGTILSDLLPNNLERTELLCTHRIKLRKK